MHWVSGALSPAVNRTGAWRWPHTSI